MKKCYVCKKYFSPYRTSQKCCCLQCHKIYQHNYNKKRGDWKLDKWKKYQKTYKQSDKYKESQKRYRQTEHAKQLRKIVLESDKVKQTTIRYIASGRRKHLNKIWLKTLNGKFYRLRCKLKREERESNCIHSFTKEEWKQKCEATKGICPYCNKPFDNNLHKLTLDHIFALYWANEYFKQTGIKYVYTIDKVQPMCLSCNCSKKDKIISNLKPKGLYIPVSY